VILDRLGMRHYDAAEAVVMKEDLVRIYSEIYADKLLDPFFTVERFRERFDAHSSAPDFKLVMASRDEDTLGYIYGFRLSPDSRWFRGVRDSLPRELTLALADCDVFAVCEVMVRQEWQRRGIATALHQELWNSRRERVFTLLIEEGNKPSEAAHASWGYRPVGSMQPFPDAPVYISMFLQRAES
jgi:GNAT superfamily N-acetyltransferase